MSLRLVFVFARINFLPFEAATMLPPLSICDKARELKIKKTKALALHVLDYLPILPFNYLTS